MSCKETMHRVRPLLYEARKQRVPPGLDDKIITAWNGMMISAMAEAGRVLGSVGLCRMRHSGPRISCCRCPSHGSMTVCYRTSRNGRAHLEAVSGRLRVFGEGLVDLYEAGGDDRYLEAARQLAERLSRFSFQDDEQGGFFTTAKEHETLIIRGREGADGATPSGNAVAAMLLARLSFHLDRADFREAAIGAIRAYGRHMTRYPRGVRQELGCRRSS